ncbi:SIMPL domain-containing protein [Xanthomonas sacchari]|uniref:SIMPL domain-containing protein n=1 Tax=Xanthomonas sacchari TaxID=56458 RepID=UPI00224DBB24|nr:SIMPL domain-containing protein [Xanthomonas sacchari]MCW0453980.1 hypothetical protein [Xanthomonas sacchari]
MKVRTLVAWAFAAVLVLPAVASAQVNSLPSQPHLLVKGEAQREVVPDRFSLRINLRAVDMQPDLARKRIQASAEQILSALKRNRALQDSIMASSLQIQPSYRFSPQGGTQEFEGTEVKRSIGATFRSLDDARQFLSGFKTSREVELSGIQTSYSKEDEIRMQLKREAAEQTRVSAEGLAKAYGVRIQGLYTISDVAPSFSYGIQAGTWPAARNVRAGFVSSPEPPAPASDVGAIVDSLEAGTLTLSENVYAVFLIAQ